MQKRITYSLILLFISQLLPAAAPVLELEDILQRHAEAMGGKAKWQQLHSWKMVSERADGRQTASFAKKPHQFKLIFTHQDQRTIKSYDGQNGWTMKNEQVSAMRPGEAIEMAEEPDFYEELMFSREKGYDVRLFGKEKFNGHSVYRIELHKSEKDIQTYFVNAKTFFIDAVGEYSEDKAWEGVHFVTLFRDYRPVDGLMFAHRWALQVGDRDPVWRALTYIELNPILLDEVFAQPQKDQIHDTRSLVRAMHAAATEANFLQYTFVQTTIRYTKEQTPRDTATWYESLHYPDKFRIDLGHPKEGNAVIYRQDSVYRFRDGALARTGQEYMPFLLLEGGLKCHPLDSVLARMTRYGYDNSRFRRDTWKGVPVYVIGAKSPDDMGSMQIWVEAERLIPLRRIDPKPGGVLLEVAYSGFENHDGGWIESRVDFWLNGKLLQVEFYNEINTRVHLEPSLFEPARFGEWHWKK